MSAVICSRCQKPIPLDVEHTEALCASCGTRMYRVGGGPRWESGLERAVRAQEDAINHPAHYTRGGVEAIDVIEAWGLGFHLGNAVKYISRAGVKTPDVATDLKKARWYLDRAIKAAEAEASKP